MDIIETIHNIKIAEKVNQLCISQNNRKINVFLQVNTSNETSIIFGLLNFKDKTGLDVNDVLMTANYICENLKNLKIKGLMTIGSINSSQKLLNPDFQILYSCFTFLLIVE